MELKRKTIELIEVSPEFCLDTLYANTAYDTPFVIEDKYGMLHTVSLAWYQGRYNNYRFVIGDDVFNDLSDFVHPKDVAFIEVR
ncbi:hypothetical protein FDI95_gp196 [Citrobacter phage CF1 ERZ-2017]|uniref:Uncharacterized protein n=1 Tax=Citrobacter phage CF1 ERZ-2017 TaxID=2267236 RepID=A0A2H4YG46_9CAUD|nr:hypothetical protein FDI95_gp196 [Citrobacter phage CF1 ERZ-2017]AUE23137.1 hypothetical protein Cf1_00274 [Citrobacter phage CF1 ERZ-2017]